MKFYTGDITYSPKTVFVFGSNPLGINGNIRTGAGGAALVAVMQFGVSPSEIMDNCFSRNGCAYGLVTVMAPGMRRSLTKEQIIKNIQLLYETARLTPDKDFKVAYRNTNKPSLNGYTGKEMAEMFIEAGEIPENIWFSEEWQKEYFNKARELWH